MVRWDYYDKFEDIINKYMPDRGEGETMASQIVTAVNKLVYKWYNDGDVFDNTVGMDGWCNDISSYANWLRKYAVAGHILDDVFDCWNGDDYEEILKRLADFYLTENGLEIWNAIPKVGNIYKCDGPYRFVEGDEEDE